MQQKERTRRLAGVLTVTLFIFWSVQRCPWRIMITFLCAYKASFFGLWFCAAHDQCTFLIESKKWELHTESPIRAMFNQLSVARWRSESTPCEKKMVTLAHSSRYISPVSIPLLWDLWRSRNHSGSMWSSNSKFRTRTTSTDSWQMVSPWNIYNEHPQSLQSPDSISFLDFLDSSLGHH